MLDTVGLLDDRLSWLRANFSEGPAGIVHKFLEMWVPVKPRSDALSGHLCPAGVVIPGTERHTSARLGITRSPPTADSSYSDFLTCPAGSAAILRFPMAPLFQWLQHRSAGVLLHPTSLPGSTGIGTIGREARHFVDFLSEAGMKNWQVCPLGPTGFGDSPYQCFSAFAGNPYFIDLETLVGQRLLDEHDLAELRRLPTDKVDYGAQWVLRWPILRKAFRTFIADASRAEKNEFAAFKRSKKEWLDPYTRFIALKGKFDGCSWQNWPEELKRYPIAKKSVLKSELGEEIEAQAWCQFEFFRQWLSLKQYANSRGIQIFGDIPIFVAMDSADVWTHPSLFEMDSNLDPRAVAGVPPDYFAADGQLWGNPLYDWKRHKATNYAWWLARLRASFELYDIIRIDHFRGFDEYCKIPADAANAREYEWAARSRD